MENIFNIIQDNNKYNEQSIDYIIQLINKNTIDFEVNWVKYLHVFYIDKIDFKDDYLKDIIYKNIKSTFDTNYFYELNIKFNIINKLNASYNQIINYNNYTLYRLQDIYIEYLINNESLLHDLFNFIININSNSKHMQYMYILSDYLKNFSEKYNNNIVRQNNYNKYIRLYSIWLADYYKTKYYESKLQLSEICTNIIEINKINDIYIDIQGRCIFTYNLICNLIEILKLYFEHILIDNIAIDTIILDTFNMIYISDLNYENIIIDFTNRWLENIQNKNYSNSEIIDNYLKISPIIYYYIKLDILQNYSILYNNRPNLLTDILDILNDTIILNYNKEEEDMEIDINIKNILSLIILYKENNEICDKYFTLLNKRINNYLKTNLLTKNIITIELNIYNYLANNYNIISLNIKLYLDDLNNSIIHKQYIQNCNFKFINDKNEEQIYDISNLNKIDYILLDSYTNTKYLQLIKTSMYPKDIITYYSIGKTYYNKLYEIHKLIWYIEQSIIDITINNMNIICNIVQYTLISYINNNNYTIDELITYIANSLLVSDSIIYLKSYINNLLINNIIKLNNNKLIIANYTEIIKFDISTFEPSLNNDVINLALINVPELIIDKDSIEYLRYLLLVKMFKHNSTKIFKLINIINEVNNFIDYSKLNINLKKIFNINQIELKKHLLYIEKRDIIDQIKADEYIYVI